MLRLGQSLLNLSDQMAIGLPMMTILESYIFNYSVVDSFIKILSLNCLCCISSPISVGIFRALAFWFNFFDTWFFR